MSQERVRVGIIGANAHSGWGHRAHLPALLALPEFELTAVCTSRKETAEESARAYGARLAFDDYRKLAEHPDVDLVIVCVRALHHYAMTMSAIQAGKHVFCEWPLGADLSQAQETAQQARARGVRHMVGLQARASPPLRYLRELVNSGYLGRHLTCHMTMFLPPPPRTSQRAWLARRESGTHVLNIHTGHAIDVLCWLMGEFVGLAGQVRTQTPHWTLSDTGASIEATAPDNVSIVGQLASGAAACVHVATVPAHGSGWRLEVYGDDATIVASSRQMVQYGEVVLRGARKSEPELVPMPVPSDLTPVPAGVPKGEPLNVAILLRDLAAGIREGREVHPNFDDAVQRHRLLHVIEESWAQRRWVRTAT